MKLKAASFVYSFVSLCICICVYFLEANVNLVMLGYYGTTDNVASLLVIPLIPIFLFVFLLSFYRNKIINVISSLGVCFLYLMRVMAFIKNMSNLKFQEKLTSEKLIFYSVLLIVFLIIALGFLMLSFSKSIQFKATSILKVISIISIVVFGIATVLFGLAIFILSDEIAMRRFFIVFSIIFLFDVINSVFMLFSVNYLNKTIYEYNNK